MIVLGGACSVHAMCMLLVLLLLLLLLLLILLLILLILLLLILILILVLILLLILLILVLLILLILLLRSAVHCSHIASCWCYSEVLHITHALSVAGAAEDNCCLLLSCFVSCV